VRSHPGLARRTALVNCVKPRNRKTDTALLSRLCSELEPYTSKLLEIPVERIREVLLDRGAKNPQETVNYWQHLCEVDAIAAWADESLTLSPNAEAIIGKDRGDTSELFGHYSQFCQRSGKTPKAFNVFSADLLTLLKDTVGLPIERVRKRTVAGEPTVLVGVRLKQTVNESGIFLYLSGVMPVMPSSSSNVSGHAVSSAKVMPSGISLAERHNLGKASGMTEPHIYQGRHNWHNSEGVKNISEFDTKVIDHDDDY
jgi:hypothetical protein